MHFEGRTPIYMLEIVVTNERDDEIGALDEVFANSSRETMSWGLKLKGKCFVLWCGKQSPFWVGEGSLL